MKRTYKGKLRDILARSMRRLRASRRLTQEGLAFDLGINRTYLSSVERSERNVSVDNIERISSRRSIREAPSAHGRLREVLRHRRNGRNSHSNQSARRGKALRSAFLCLARIGRHYSDGLSELDAQIREPPTQ